MSTDHIKRGQGNWDCSVLGRGSFRGTLSTPEDGRKKMDIDPSQGLGQEAISIEIFI